MNTDLINELKALDPTHGAAQPSEAAFAELCAGILAQPRPLAGPSAGRWFGAAAAAAAVVTATVLLWPGNATTGPLPAIPAASPSPGSTLNTWTMTAPSPLRPRHASFAAWVDGTFLVIGGDTSSPCDPPGPSGEYCGSTSEPSDDGARYDPATDAWTRIADAPVPVEDFDLLVGTFPKSAVVGHTMYLIGPDSLLAYDVDADRWQRYAMPAGGSQAILLAASDRLLAIDLSGDGAPAYQTLDLGSGTWRSHPIDGIPGHPSGAMFADGALVLSGITGHDLSALWIVTLDLGSGAVKSVDKPAIPTQRPMPLRVQTGKGTLVGWARSGDTGWFLEPSTGVWSRVTLPAAKGPFRPFQRRAQLNQYVTAAGMIALNGYLYDPVTHLWALSPPLPTLSDSPLLVGGDDSVLACFGFEISSNSFRSGKDCYLLRPSPASSESP